ncbi:hypothetical protein PAXRUDRAFT_497521 [Paxillus rubicundulus Ve08.2h10]|uniref:Uncharacterized protein n=1 Tax=Paxillus rubicundulus Ve08.2h10 TaxID=930991 RepID=A0A0D0DLP6_9AGAM|nr:hypothetical protein PAXRUDRAFT_497521 [Paxillus rubicundulus Ve08.2h10]
MAMRPRESCRAQSGCVAKVEIIYCGGCQVVFIATGRSDSPCALTAYRSSDHLLLFPAVLHEPLNKSYSGPNRE